MHPPLCTSLNLRRMWGSNSNETRRARCRWCNNVSFLFVQCSSIVYILLEQLWEGGVCWCYRQCCQRSSTFTFSCVDILQFKKRETKNLKKKKNLNWKEKFKIVIFYTCMYRERENCCCSSEIMFVNKFLKWLGFCCFFLWASIWPICHKREPIFFL